MNGELNLADAQAWAWLENLPRLDWKQVLAEAQAKGARYPGANMRQITEGQISVRMVPRAGIGQPLIRLSVAMPGHKKRFRGSGNDLPEAVRSLHSELWRAGIRTPFPDL